MKEWTCAGKECPEYKAKKCGEVMNLRFILPEVPGLGVWQIDTGSINSILNINSCAKIIKSAFGRISMVPLSLTLEPIDVNNPETGKKQKVFVLNLRSQVTMAQLADSAREQAKTFLLEAPDWDAVMEQKAETDIETLWGDDTQKPTPEETTSKQDTIAETSKEKPCDFDVDWLVDTLKRINWNEKTTKSYLSSHFHVQTDGTVQDIMAQLIPGQREAFFKEIQDRKGL
jgi:hypothetical protein